MSTLQAFTWNANAEPDIDHYNLYAGTAPLTYTTIQSMGNTTSGTFLVTVATTWYFALTAVNSSNSESGFSAEISRLYDFEPPAQGLMDTLGAMAAY